MNNKLIPLIMTLVVGIILAGSLLVPVLSDAQKTIGPETTLTNNSLIVLRELENGDVLECVRTVTGDTATDVWTLNGETVAGPTGGANSWNVGLMSDGIYLAVNAESNSAVASWYSMNATTTNPSYLSGGGSSGAHYGIVALDGTITIYSDYGSESPTTITTKTYTWGYVVCPYADGEYCAAVPHGVGLVKSPDQVILCGAYTTGDLDTMYYYKDGQTYVSETAYTMTANIATAVHTGTTDIYDATVSVDIANGDDVESFTPYRILVPYEVTGHKASGASYSLLGAIPIIVIAALIVAAIGMVAVRRND